MNSNLQPEFKQVIEIVCATRHSEGDFWTKSALGQSITSIAYDPRIVTRLSFENKRGLPDVYNESIRAHHEHEILLFIHDDVWIHDFFFTHRLFEAIKVYDIVGIVGNRCRNPNQVAWCSKGSTLERDGEFLSGVVGDGDPPNILANVFGPTPMECELLDGLFLAGKKKALLDRQALFDPIFDFHFYDMDFCRSARQKGLKLGTYPISVSHQSKGSIGSQAWRLKCSAYFQKWGD